MRPTEVELEAAAQQRDAEHGKITAAFEACSELDGDAFDECLVSQGVDRGSESADEVVGSIQLQAALRAEAFRIAARGDARSLVAAALVMPGPASSRDQSAAPERAPEAVTWLAQAQQLGRNDALVQWSVTLTAPPGVAPDAPALEAARAAARERLPILEPDNAAAFVFATAHGRSPGSGLSRIELSRAAALPRYRVPTADQITLVLDATRDMPAYPGLRQQAVRMNPDHEAAAACASDDELLRELRMVTAIMPAVAAEAFPGALSESCSPQSVEREPGARSQCLRLLDRIHAQGSTIEQARAAVLARGIATSGLDLALWERRHRLYLWRQFQMMKAGEFVDPYELSRIFEHAWRSGSEDRATDELLTRAGIPLEPPPDWQPPIGH